MFGESRVGRYLKKRCYDEETGFLLNYVTLVISEPEIKKQLFNHKGEQFKRIIWPITVSLVLSFLQTVYDLYFLKTGHPIWIVTASLDLLLLRRSYCLLLLTCVCSCLRFQRVVAAILERLLKVAAWKLHLDNFYSSKRSTTHWFQVNCSNYFPTFYGHFLRPV
jgi:hypothetical protein